MEFAELKRRRLADADLSRKGSIDSAILELCELINSLPAYFTTSSCSGRVVVFENNEAEEAEGVVGGGGGVQKKGCKWLHVTHNRADCRDVMASLEGHSHEAVLKFEPMICHIQCRSLAAAQLMHQTAVAAGFRNSGITVGSRGKTMVAVRSTHGLEAPLSARGRMLVSEEYVQHLVDSANRKMETNLARIARFLDNVKAAAGEMCGLCADNKTCDDAINIKDDKKANKRKRMKEKRDKEKLNGRSKKSDKTSKEEVFDFDCDAVIGIFDDS